jgi:hypothetical protein
MSLKFCRLCQLAQSFINAALTRSDLSASKSDWYLNLKMGLLAMITRSYPCCSSASSLWKADLIRRFARFRWTALPTDRPAMMAILLWVNWFGKVPNTIMACAKDLPSWRTRWISWLRVNRDFRFNQLPVQQDTSNFTEFDLVYMIKLPAYSFHMVVGFFCQLSPAFGPTSFQYFATTFGLHPCSKTMLPNSAASLGLICSLWHPLWVLSFDTLTYSLNSPEFKTAINYTVCPFHGQTAPRQLSIKRDLCKTCWKKEGCETWVENSPLLPQDLFTVDWLNGLWFYQNK